MSVFDVKPPSGTSAGSKVDTAADPARSRRAGPSASAEAFALRPPSKRAANTLSGLRRAAKTDPEAGQQAAWYESRTDAQLRRLESEGDPIARGLLNKRFGPRRAFQEIRPSNPALLKTLRSDLKDARAEVERAYRQAKAAGDELPARPGPPVWEGNVKGAKGLENIVVPTTKQIWRYRGTVGVARTDIPALSGRLFRGGSPEADLRIGEAGRGRIRATAAPELTQAHGHAEEVLANQLDRALTNLSPQDAAAARGKTVYMHIDQEVCSGCGSGLRSDVRAGVLKQLSQHHPDIVFEITANDTSQVIRIRNGADVSGEVTQAAEAAAATPSTELQPGTAPESQAPESDTPTAPEAKPAAPVAKEVPGMTEAIRDMKAGPEGAAMILHGMQESGENEYQHRKEAAELKRMEPLIELQRTSGKWVVVQSVWLKTRDFFADVSGFHEPGDLPVFKRIMFQTGWSRQEALHPQAGMSAQPDNVRTESSASLPDDELKAHPGRYEEDQIYAILPPLEAGPARTAALDKFGGGPLDDWGRTGRSHPDTAGLAGLYAADGGAYDHVFLLESARDGLWIASARTGLTGDDYNIAAQRWQWSGSFGILRSTLAGSPGRAGIASTIIFNLMPGYGSVVESFAVIEDNVPGKMQIRTLSRVRRPG